MRASPSGKASAFQADIRRFESGRPLFLKGLSHQKAPPFLGGVFSFGELDFL